MNSIKIPDNMCKYLKEHDGANIAINYNSAGADDGYVHMIHKSVVLSQITRTCNRCGYDPLWKPDDSESKCLRHTYGNWRYDNVFVYSEKNNHLTLEKCFEIFLNSQPKEALAPCKFMSFGRIGWK